jgi:TonB family protein
MLQDNKPASAEKLNDSEQVSAPTLSEHKRASIMNWGMAAALATGLGLVLLYSRPAWDGKTSTSERLPRATAHAGQASGARQGLDHYSAQAPGTLNGGAASGPEERGAPPGDSPVASGALSRPFELRRASDKRTAQDVGERATRAMADAQSHVDTTSTGITPVAAGASSAPIEAAEARPTAPVPTSPFARAPAIARAPPRARIAPAIHGVPVGAGSSRGPIRSPPRWIGGGPTDADNREGRYQGTVAVQIAIDPGGRVSNCAPVRGSGNAGLDAMTCRLVKERARFTPALDAQGRPVVSQAYRTIVWSRR